MEIFYLQKLKCIACENYYSLAMSTQNLRSLRENEIPE